MVQGTTDEVIGVKQRLVDELADVLVDHPVVHPVPVPARQDEPAESKLRQMLRHRRRRRAEYLGETGDRTLAVHQDVKQPEAGHVGEELQHLDRRTVRCNRRMLGYLRSHACRVVRMRDCGAPTGPERRRARSRIGSSLVVTQNRGHVRRRTGRPGAGHKIGGARPEIASHAMSTRRATSLVLSIAVLLAVAACTSGDDGGATTTVTIATTTTTSTSATGPTTTTPDSNVTTTASVSDTTTTTSSGNVAGTPDAAAQGLYAAWKNGDRTAAAAFAEPEVIAELFSRTFTGPEEQFVGCDPDGVTFACNYLYEGGSTNYRAVGDPDAGYRIVEIGQTAD